MISKKDFWKSTHFEKVHRFTFCYISEMQKKCVLSPKVLQSTHFDPKMCTFCCCKHITKKVYTLFQKCVRFTHNTFLLYLTFWLTQQHTTPPPPPPPPPNSNYHSISFHSISFILLWLSGAKPPLVLLFYLLFNFPTLIIISFHSTAFHSISFIAYKLTNLFTRGCASLHIKLIINFYQL
jgi:hypothetical protein